MENKKSPLLIYREKTYEIHTLEDIKAAFENSYAVCFNFDSGHDRAKYALFAAIWGVNPDVIITEVDLCELGPEPDIMRNQFLLINKNGTKEMSNTIMQFIAESGTVSSAYCFFGEKKAGIKGCHRRVFNNDKPSIVKKGNLLIDGDKIIITVRTQTKADTGR
ncbi:MAG: hypothetical protein ACI4QR_01500 [Eubacteriales bacterium]